MRKHRIDISPVTEDLTAVSTKTAEIVAALGFLVPLEEGERKALPRLGLRNETFALGVIDLARQNPQVVPAGIDMAALQRDVAAREALLPLFRELQRITNLLQDTLTLLGCDMYEGSRALYKSMKVIGDLHGLAEAIAELGRRFANQGRSQQAPGTTPPPATQG